MNVCYAVGSTNLGYELRCDLPRSHKSDHWDDVREEWWRVDLLADAWATADIHG